MMHDKQEAHPVSVVCFSMQPFRQTWGMLRLPDAFTQHHKPHPTPLGPEGKKGGKEGRREGGKEGRRKEGGKKMEGRREERRKGIASVTIAPRRHSHDYIRTTIALLLWNIPDIHRPYAVRPLRSKPKRHRKWQTVPRCPPSVPQHKQRTGYASKGKSPPTTNCPPPRQPPAGKFHTERTRTPYLPFPCIVPDAQRALRHSMPQRSPLSADSDAPPSTGGRIHPVNVCSDIPKPLRR